MAADADAYKAGMRRLAASVAVLTTTLADARAYGMTATAVCSVSADPPTLLCCINRQSAGRAAFLEASHFGVNLLTTGDRDIADRFASRISPEERFARGSWRRAAGEVPLLDSAIASFACRRSAMVEVGSHTVFFGEVETVDVRGEHLAPLLYAHGGYGHFSRQSTALPDLMWTPNWNAEV